MNEIGRGTVHHMQLPEASPSDVLYEEWSTYRREVARLLAEGKCGQFALIKGRQVVAAYDSWQEAREAGLRLYLREPFLVQQVCLEVPILRVRGYSVPCRS
jgi:hypothetical protein